LDALRNPMYGFLISRPPVNMRGFCCQKARLTVVDLGSRNRTWVNGEPIPQGQKRTLASGDVVTIGSLTLVLHRTGVMRNTPQTLAPMVLEMGDGATLLADPAMVRLYELLRRLARSMLPILITGETGTGKENAAQAVHHFSARSAGPLVCINCAAVPDNLFESELFGHVRGAFFWRYRRQVGTTRECQWWNGIFSMKLASYRWLRRPRFCGYWKPEC
jgi:hypothetical protein